VIVPKTTTLRWGAFLGSILALSLAVTAINRGNADPSPGASSAKPVKRQAVADAGWPFSVDAHQDGKHYVLASTVERTQIDGKSALRMKMRITEDGKLLTEPAIAVESGRAARVQVGEDIAGKAGHTSFKGVRLDIVLTDSMPVAVGVPKPAAMPASTPSAEPKPITAKQAMAATTGEFNTYERMLTSISASWQPPKPAEEGC